MEQKVLSIINEIRAAKSLEPVAELKEETRLREVR